MRAIIFFSSIFFVASSILCGLVTELLTLYGVSFRYNSLLSYMNWFGLLAPRLASMFLPPLVLAVLVSGTVFLLLRRMWLLIVKKERVPSSFRGISKISGYIGICSFFLTLLLLPIVKGGGYFIMALFFVLLLPSVFFTFVAFILTELFSFHWRLFKHEA